MCNQVKNYIQGTEMSQTIVNKAYMNESKQAKIKQKYNKNLIIL